MKRISPPRPDEFDDPRRDLMMQQVWEDCRGKVGFFRRAYAGTAAPSQAIKAFCLDCQWLDEEAIRNCTATNCPLWCYRPFKRWMGRKSRTR